MRTQNDKNNSLEMHAYAMVDKIHRIRDAMMTSLASSDLVVSIIAELETLAAKTRSIVANPNMSAKEKVDRIREEIFQDQAKINDLLATYKHPLPKIVSNELQTYFSTLQEIASEVTKEEIEDLQHQADDDEVDFSESATFEDDDIDQSEIDYSDDEAAPTPAAAPEPENPNTKDMQMKQARVKISDKDLQKQIRDGLARAFTHVEDLSEDGIAKIGATQVSLLDLENRAAGSYSNKELHDLYQHPEKDKERGVLILDRIGNGEKDSTATIYRRVSAKALHDTFGVKQSEKLNFRQLALINAAIFGVTSDIVNKLMAANPLDKTTNSRVEKATRAVLKKIDFTKLGMENPGDNKPRVEFTATLNPMPKKRFLQSTSDPLKPKPASTPLRRLSMFGSKTVAVSSPMLQPKSEIDSLKERIKTLEKAMQSIYEKEGGADVKDMQALKDFGKELEKQEKKLAEIQGPQTSPRGP